MLFRFASSQSPRSLVVLRNLDARRRLPRSVRTIVNAAPFSRLIVQFSDPSGREATAKVEGLAKALREEMVDRVAAV